MSVIYSCRHYIIAFWTIAFLVSAWYAPRYISSTELAFEAPKGSPSYIANRLVSEVFPELSRGLPLIVFLNNDNLTAPVQDVPAIEDFFNFVNATIYNCSTQVVVESLSYFKFRVGYESIAAQFLSPSENSLIAVYQFENHGFESFFSMVDLLRDTIDEHPLSTDASFFIDVVSQGAVFLDMRRAAITDLANIDSIVLPLALLVSALFLQSLSLISIPIVSVVFSIVISFALSLPFSLYVYKFASFTPSIQTTLVIAMSIDYSLFMLTRFKEEYRKSLHLVSSVQKMVKFSGEIVVVSGLTLAICFLGLVFFPLEILKTIGIGATVSLVVTISINVTLTPSLIYVLPRFFTYRLVKKGSSSLQLSNIQDISFGRNSNPSFFFKLTQLTTAKLGAVIVIISITLLILPIGLKMRDFEWTIDNSLFISDNARSKVALDQMSEQFSKGLYSPFNIVTVSKNRTEDIFDETYFDLCHSFLNKYNQSFPGHINDVISMCFMEGNFLTFEQAKFLRKWNQEFEWAVNHMLSKESNGALITIKVDFDPFGDKSIAFIDSVSSILSDIAATYDSQFDIGFTSMSNEQLDASRAILAKFPLMVITVLSIVFVLFSITFKSILVPLRLLVTIVLTISFIFGLGIIVYQDGTFLSQYFHAFTPTGKILWIIPIMSFCILCGLALDYDCFLSLRIREYRLLGYTNRAAVIKGSAQTGSVITFAGLIMSIAFSGLMMSETSVLYVFGFLLSFAVLMDTFVIRTLVVPALTSLLGGLIWFPGKVPEGILCEYDDVEPLLE
ncbi:hypothetical protein GEMRC1_007885 [Eukaryota sp. GEM-RC1]